MYTFWQKFNIQLLYLQKHKICLPVSPLWKMGRVRRSFSCEFPNTPTWLDDMSQEVTVEEYNLFCLKTYIKTRSKSLYLFYWLNNKTFLIYEIKKKHWFVMLYVGEFAIFKENFVTQPRQVCIQKVIFKIPKFLLTNYSCHAIEYKNFF